MDKGIKNHLAIICAERTHVKMDASHSFAKIKRFLTSYNVAISKRDSFRDESGELRYWPVAHPSVVDAESNAEYLETLEAYKKYLMPTFQWLEKLINELAKSLIVVAALLIAAIIDDFKKIFETYPIKEHKLKIELPPTLAPRLLQSPAAHL
ncbi:hypothetical protein [Sulfuriferula thiophila]|uniref:hypothetical protein n=1 Tax=Sulfuriferula thiophila TaxID=1781211 RepID=UPI000F605DEE|nr:hypothetical protein [Sulfuriferula thiophila]